MQRNRVWYLMAVVLTIAAGLASRKFNSYLPAFLGKYPGDAIWALMVFFGVGLLLPTASSLRVAATSIAFSVCIELLKLIQSPWLVHLRHTTAGHLVFGSIFSWQNLIAYVIGIGLGCLLELLIQVGNGPTVGGAGSCRHPHRSTPDRSP